MKIYMKHIIYVNVVVYISQLYLVSSRPSARGSLPGEVISISYITRLQTAVQH